MGKQEYKPMSGTDARARLNELGYAVKNEDAWMVMFGLVVAMAEEIETLRKRYGKEDRLPKATAVVQRVGGSFTDEELAKIKRLAVAAVRADQNRTGDR